MSTPVSGLVSGFDWSTYIDTIMTYAGAPITKLKTEQQANSDQSDALNALKSVIGKLQTSVDDLATGTVFTSRTTSLASSTPGWSATAANGASLGSHTITVSQLATTSRLSGGTGIASPLSDSSDVSGLTLSTLPTASAITAGTFTINGAQVSVDLADSLQDVFDKISTATGGDVTASYDSASDHVTLSSSSGEIVLGTATDTSNFLSALRLSNNGTGTIGSSARLGALTRTAPLASSHLSTAVSGSGSFSINGVAISYDTATDSLDTLLARINASSAGVTASYDATGGRLSLGNNTTGDVGIAVTDDAGGILGALGLTAGAGAALTRGRDNLFSIDNGTTQTSHSNTLDATTLGVTGLSLTVTATGSDTLAVAADTQAMKDEVNSFIDAYNAVQSNIDTQTKITSKDGKVTTSTLSSNREVSSWSDTLRSLAFSAVSGLSGTISRLENLGIDFSSGGGDLLQLKDETKLDAALQDHPDEVNAFFTTATTGFGARMKDFLSHVVGDDYTTGYIEQQTTTLANRNSDIDDQIATIQRQLDQQRQMLVDSFTAMENAQQSYNNMQTQLTNAFSSSSSSTKKSA